MSEEHLIGPSIPVASFLGTRQPALPGVIAGKIVNEIIVTMGTMTLLEHTVATMETRSLMEHIVRKMETDNDLGNQRSICHYFRLSFVPMREISLIEVAS
jgi:hypothetical protein